jgi:hypothetical protein
MLDENISYVVAEQIQSKRPEIRIESVHTWQEGVYRGVPDDDLLTALHAEGWLLATYDTQILAEQPFLFDGSVPFSGILFVDERTIAHHDFGALIRALIAFWENHQAQSWENRIGFLSRSESS